MSSAIAALQSLEQITRMRYPGLPFFMMIGAALASRAPASMNRVIAWAITSPVTSSTLVSSTSTRVLRQPGAFSCGLDNHCADNVGGVMWDRGSLHHNPPTGSCQRRWRPEPRSRTLQAVRLLSECRAPPSPPAKVANPDPCRTATVAGAGRGNVP